MYIDKLLLLNMDKSPFMPIELEIERVLTELGYMVENLKEGLFWVVEGSTFWTVIPSGSAHLLLQFVNNKYRKLYERQ